VEYLAPNDDFWIKAGNIDRLYEGKWQLTVDKARDEWDRRDEG
jgi:hypothetical protein